MKFWIMRGGWAALWVLATSGCITGGDKCDAHQVEFDEGGYFLCVCEPGSVIDPSGVGCNPCGANEEAREEMCACKPGFAKLSPESGCEKSEIGASCSSEAECPPTYPYCAAADAAGYCTARDCTANADCPEGWSCEEAAGIRHCAKPPTGLGTSCTSNDDCSAFAASYCDTIQTHSCILQGCAVGQGACPNEWACCDYSALLGAPFSTCAPPSALSEGACPSGGTMVTP